MTPFWKLSAAGFAATAVTFGPARMGFGLFLPEFRLAFSMSTGSAGVVSSLGFLGFLLGLVVASAMTSRRGARLPVVVGLIAATLGMALVAAAPNLPSLAAGVFFAMASAGWTWAPFNHAVHHHVADERRPAALSIVSTGTSLGVAAAGATAIAISASGLSWRAGWAVFACLGAAAAIANWAALRDLGGGSGQRSDARWSALALGAAVPLYAIALSFGTTTAVYISFAADRIEQAGGIPGLPTDAASAVLFMAYGVVGLVGLATGRAKAVAGLPGLLRLLLLTSALSLTLVAAMPTSWPGVVLSAGLQGIYVMMMSAILAFWSERLFPALPSESFTAALLAVAVGNVFGPVVAGYAADAFGGAPMFFGAAILSALTAVAVLPGYVRERSAPA